MSVFWNWKSSFMVVRDATFFYLGNAVSSILFYLEVYEIKIGEIGKWTNSAFLVLNVNVLKGNDFFRDTF